MAANEATCEAIWLRKLLVGLFRQRMEATNVCCYNQSCIKLFENPVFHDRSKHIDIHCHFIRDCVQRGAVQLQYVPTEEQVANILTKAQGQISSSISENKWVWWRTRFSSRERLFWML